MEVGYLRNTKEGREHSGRVIICHLFTSDWTSPVAWFLRLQPCLKCAFNVLTEMSNRFTITVTRQSNKRAEKLNMELESLWSIVNLSNRDQPLAVDWWTIEVTYAKQSRLGTYRILCDVISPCNKNQWFAAAQLWLELPALWTVSKK